MSFLNNNYHCIAVYVFFFSRIYIYHFTFNLINNAFNLLFFMVHFDVIEILQQNFYPGFDDIYMYSKNTSLHIKQINVIFLKCETVFKSSLITVQKFFLSE
jgi:hypothetical protein